MLQIPPALAGLMSSCFRTRRRRCPEYEYRRLDRLRDRHFDDRRAGCHCHSKTEISLSTAEGYPIGLRTPPNDREIRGNRMLEDALLTTVFPHFLVLAEVSAGTGRREEGRNAGTAGPDAFGECALRDHFYFKIAV